MTTNPYVLGGEIAFVALIVALIGWQHHRIGTLKAERDAQRTTISNYASANKANVDAIAALKRANIAWQARGLSAEDSANAVAALTIERDHLKSELANRKTNREIIYATEPHARAWADAGMPAAIADALWLQERAANRPH
jgi:Protein of unknown function (DUF2570).